MEYIELIFSLETELQIESIYSIRIFSTEEVIEVLLKIIKYSTLAVAYEWRFLCCAVLLLTSC